MQAPLFYPSISLLIGVILSFFIGRAELFPLLVILIGFFIAEQRDRKWSRWRWRGMALIFGFCLGFIYQNSDQESISPQSVRLLGKIIGEVSRRAQTQTFDFKPENQERLSEKIYLVTTKDRREFQWGDRIEVKGILRSFKGAQNPGEWNEREWQNLRGVSGGIETYEISMISNESVFCWGKYFISLREKAKKHLIAGGFGTAEERALIQGMVLGDTSEMSRELKEKFRSTGTGHIFAVSGQNLGVILAMLIFGMRFLRINSWRWGWLSLLPLFIYSGMSGFQSSCIRAWIMLALLLIAWRIDRPAIWLNFWSATLILVILRNPLSVQDLGFQLSFVVVLGLILGTPWGMEKLKPLWEWEAFLSRNYSTPFQRLWYWCRKEGYGVLVGSTMAFIAVLPHSALVFHSINGISLLLNLVVVPLAGFIVMGGTFSLLMGGINDLLPIFTNYFLIYLSKAVLFLVNGASVMTWLQFPICDIHAWRWNESPQIIVFDLGEVPQGMIRYQGEIWLVNTGTKNNYDLKFQSVLKYFGVSKIEGILMTTISETSNGGLIPLLGDYPVKRLIRHEERGRSPLEKKWDQTLSGHQFERWNQESKQVWSSDFRVALMKAGEPHEEESQGTEDQGLVLDFEYQGRNFIWGNRISEKKELEISQLDKKERAIEAIVQGRNPRENNLSEGWLEFLSPRYLIVSRSSRANQKTGYDTAWNLRQRTSAKVIFLEQTGAMVLDWGEGLRIRSWSEGF